jgi:hypothetical protein
MIALALPGNQLDTGSSLGRLRMLEILFLMWFYKVLAKQAEAKNRTRSWGWLGIIGWLGGEFTGFGMQDGGDFGATYGTALIAGAIGAGLAALVVAMLPTVKNDDFPAARVV